MQKIIGLFKRHYDGEKKGEIYNEITPGAEWVVNGEGVATRKWDGTCCMIRGGKLYKRYDAKNGKTPPEGFEPAQDPDPITKHWPGWLLVKDVPNDQWHREVDISNLPDGTYELCGPKLQGNPEGFTQHVLMPHGKWILEDVPTEFEALKAWLKDCFWEGIVWHHPDGRMVKIKKKDFKFDS